MSKINNGDIMATLLEKRLVDLSKRNSKVYCMMGENELQAYYEARTDGFVNNLKSAFPLRYVSRFIDWDNVKEDYKKGCDVLINQCGDMMLKEFEACPRIKDLREEEYNTEIPLIVEDVYSSLFEYVGFGAALESCAKDINSLVKQREYSFIEEFTLKPIYGLVIKALRNVGREITKAGIEAQASRCIIINKEHNRRSSKKI